MKSKATLLNLSTVGELESDQTNPGQIAEFNMWSYEMSIEQLLSNTCGTKGDVSSWDTLQQQGTSEEKSRIFPDCSGKSNI